jgi:nanoRNase/pAp phosphatase (c-di-AMP/oligoRNAs hydrolase)
MSLPELKQAATLIKKASTILLIVPAKPSPDAFASMVAFYLTLLRHHPAEHIHAVSPSHVPSALQFLPGSSQVKMSVAHQPSITLDIAGPEAIEEIHQEKLNGGVRLHITLKTGTEIEKDQIETTVRLLPYDVVITFGAADLEELGTTFTSHADFFYATPIINIDHRANNEHYGTVNLVDITHSSIAEVTHEAITALEDTVDKDIATALYAGIVAATASFQKPTTTPHAFQLAAQLLSQEADKEAVIQHLVKTKPLSLLKLSGRALARLKYDEYGGLFWSLIRSLDFRESDSNPDLIPDVIHELANNISGYNAAFLVYEDDQKHFHAYLLLGKGLLKRRQEIQERLSAKRENGFLEISLSALTLDEAESKALEAVRSILP